MNPLHEAQACTKPDAPVLVTDSFVRVQSTQGFVMVQDAMTDVIAFSGTPDRIDLWCRTFDAVVVFTDEQNRDSDEIRIVAADFYSSQIKARKVRARNQVAGSAAILQVVGKWGRPSTPAAGP